MTRNEIIKALKDIREEIIESFDLTDFAREQAVYCMDDVIAYVYENEEG